MHAYIHTYIHAYIYIYIVIYWVPLMFQTHPQGYYFNHILTTFFLFYPKRLGAKPSLKAAKQGESSAANPDEYRSGRAWKATENHPFPLMGYEWDINGIFFSTQNYGKVFPRCCRWNLLHISRLHRSRFLTFPSILELLYSDIHGDKWESIAHISQQYMIQWEGRFNTPQKPWSPWSLMEDLQIFGTTMGCGKYDREMIGSDGMIGGLGENERGSTDLPVNPSNIPIKSIQIHPNPSFPWLNSLD